MKIAIAASLATALLFAALAFGSQADAQTPTATPHPVEPELPADAIRGAASPTAAPTGFYAKRGYQSVTLIWKDVPGATGYQVMQWDGTTSGRGAWRILPFTEKAYGSYSITFYGSSALVSGLRHNASYAHTVRSVHKNGVRSAWAFVHNHSHAAAAYRNANPNAHIHNSHRFPVA